MKVVVATTAMLSFISFWRAAAIVLNDLGSSAYYAGGIAEQAIGHAAPWFILGVMLFSYAVRAAQLRSAEIIMGRSSAMTLKKQAQRLKRAWESLAQKPHSFIRLLIIEPYGEIHEFELGAHHRSPPRQTSPPTRYRAFPE